MNIVALEPSVERVFWDHVNQDIPHYFFFAFDWKHNRSETKILLALEEGRIDGMMLVYGERVVQFRGSCEAVEALLARLDLEKVELQAPEEHKRYILEKYEPTVSHELMLMLLRKGQENLQIDHSVVELNSSHAGQIADVMANADPEFWGTITKEQIAEGMRNNRWVGIRVNGELASIGRMRLTEWGGHVGIIATRSAHRNNGYATSITSWLVEHILEELRLALIYVRADNPPAVRTYRKVGFKPERTYFFMRGERRSDDAQNSS